MLTHNPSEQELMNLHDFSPAACSALWGFSLSLSLSLSLALSLSPSLLAQCSRGMSSPPVWREEGEVTRAVSTHPYTQCRSSLMMTTAAALVALATASPLPLFLALEALQALTQRILLK